MSQRSDSDEVSAPEGAEADLEELLPEPPTMGRRERMRRRILRSTALLPALFTISNGLCGFASIHFATKDPIGAAQIQNLSLACWLIFAAMVCDMLDGSLARLTRKTSDFGGQLDSLSDVISFGVAPAMLMARTVLLVLRGEPETYVAVERTVLCVAGAYMACAALRLARFNVENEPDEASHMSFSGLPSPGAAAAVVAPVLLLTWHVTNGLKLAANGWLFYAVSVGLPALTLGTALLMVSRVRYPHVVNQYVRGKRPFNYLVKFVIVALAATLYPLETIAALAVAFALWGPIRVAFKALWGRRPPTKIEIP